MDVGSVKKRELHVLAPGSRLVVLHQFRAVWMRRVHAMAVHLVAMQICRGSSSLHYRRRRLKKLSLLGHLFGLYLIEKD